MANKKITFYAPNLCGGGAERIVSILAAHFAKNGFKVDLLLGRSIGPYLNNIPSSVNIIEFKCNRIILTLPKLVSYLKKEKPDVLFSSQMHCSILALWAVKFAKVDTNVIIRQPTMLQPVFENRSLISKFRQKLLLWSAKRWSHKVVATSKVMADEFISLSKIAPDKVVVIYNPLPLTEIRRKSELPLDHSWYEKGQPPVVLAVGRLVEVKDFSTLIKAFSLVRNVINARLVILGEGSLRNELEQLVRDLDLQNDVQMPGFVENPFQYMKRSNVFVMSSLWEGFPNGMIEAMACGAKIVATNCDGGAAEILEYGKWGALVPVQSPEVMSAAILATLDTSINAAPRVADFSIDNVIDDFVNCFSKVICNVEK